MATAVRMLRLSKGMSTGTVLEWQKVAGDSVEAGEPLVSVLSDKVDVQIEAPSTGVLLQVAVPDGQEVAVGTVLGWIGQPGEALEPVADVPDANVASQKSEVSVSAQPLASPSPRGQMRASPVARRLAAEHGIDLKALVGSGPGGLISKSDVARAAEMRETHDTGLVMQSEIERIPLTGIRKVMAQRMLLSKQTAADVTTVVDVDMGAIRSLKEHVPVTYTSAVIKSAALALGQHPLLNASLSEDEILLYKRIHIGVAADTPRGLIVVTIADVDTKSLRHVNDELRQLTQASQSGSLPAKETESPTFTVTNSGVLGSLMFTPMLNPPQSATLGMGKVQETPVVRDGQIVARPVMYLCLTYDHCIVEGAEAVRFLQMVKGGLEDPARML